MIEHQRHRLSEGENLAPTILIGAGALLSLATVPLAGGIIYHTLRGNNDKAIDLAKAAAFPGLVGPILIGLGFAQGNSYIIGPDTEIKIHDKPISLPIRSEEREQSEEQSTKPQV